MHPVAEIAEISAADADVSIDQTHYLLTVERHLGILLSDRDRSLDRLLAENIHSLVARLLVQISG